MSIENPQQKSLRVVLEPYAENRIMEIKENGEEELVHEMTDEEKFNMIVGLLNFDTTATTAAKSEQESQYPVLAKPPQIPPWASLSENVRNAVVELEQMIHIVEVVRDAQILSTATIPRKQKPTSETKALSYMQKKKDLERAANILRKGHAHLKQRIQTERQFNQQLYELQSNWHIKQTGKTLNSFVVDIGKRNSLYNSVPVAVRPSEQSKTGLVFTLHNIQKASQQMFTASSTATTATTIKHGPLPPSLIAELASEISATPDESDEMSDSGSEAPAATPTSSSGDGIDYRELTRIAEVPLFNIQRSLFSIEAYELFQSALSANDRFRVVSYLENEMQIRIDESNILTCGLQKMANNTALVSNAGMPSPQKRSLEIYLSNCMGCDGVQLRILLQRAVHSYHAALQQQSVALLCRNSGYFKRKREEEHRKQETEALKEREKNKYSHNKQSTKQPTNTEKRTHTATESDKQEADKDPVKEAAKQSFINVLHFIRHRNFCVNFANTLTDLSDAWLKFQSQQQQQQPRPVVSMCVQFVSAHYPNKSIFNVQLTRTNVAQQQSIEASNDDKTQRSVDSSAARTQQQSTTPARERRDISVIIADTQLSVVIDGMYSKAAELRTANMTVDEFVLYLRRKLRELSQPISVSAATKLLL